MMRRSGAALAALLLIVTAAAARAAEDAAVANGGRLFRAVGCYECHGYAGQGGAAGPRIAPPIPYAALSAYVRHPRREMPPYTTAVLKDDDLRAIYAYLQSIPKAPPASSLPVLNR